MAKEIFYQGLLPRIIINPKNGKVLIEFDRKTRTYETDDEEIIALLEDRGYPQYEDLQILERTGRLDHGGFEKAIADEKVLPSGRKPFEKEGEKPLKKIDHLGLSETEEKVAKSPIKKPAVEIEKTIDGDTIIKRKKVPKKKSADKKTSSESKSKKNSGGKSLKRRKKSS